MKPYGKIGKYLFEQMVEYNIKTAQIPHWPHGEVWTLSDSLTVTVLMKEFGEDDLYDMLPAPTFTYEDLKYVQSETNRKIRIYKHVDTRLTMEDFYAKLSLNFPNHDA